MSIGYCHDFFHKIERWMHVTEKNEFEWSIFDHVKDIWFQTRKMIPLTQDFIFKNDAFTLIESCVIFSTFQLPPCVYLY